MNNNKGKIKYAVLFIYTWFNMKVNPHGTSLNISIIGLEHFQWELKCNTEVMRAVIACKPLNTKFQLKIYVRTIKM